MAIVAILSSVHESSSKKTGVRMESLEIIQDKLKNIERQLDKDYKACFPSSESWEKVAAHLLLAYDYTARAADSHIADRLKYDLMHALRWGENAISRPFRALPNSLDSRLFESCRLVLNRGNEYAGICGAFIAYHRGLTKVNSIGDRLIEFSDNPSWSAYDALDNLLAFQNQATPSMKNAAYIQQNVHNLSGEYEKLSPTEMMDWFPDFSTCRNLLSIVNHYVQEGRSLPDSWKYKNIPIFRIREFWKALLILGLIHSGVALQLTGNKHVGLVQLLVKPKDALVDWIAGCVGITEDSAKQLLELHTYNRSHKVPDIALTPFVHLGANHLAASPWMLICSNFERNFRAHIAREYRDANNKVSNALADKMADDLVKVFNQAEFAATKSIVFTRNGKKRDIDLLVWSSREKYMLAIELKWIITPSDFMEVLNRGEDTYRKSICEQLPEYEGILSEDTAGLVARAFNLKVKPEITGWDIGIVIRDFVGTSKMDHEKYFFLPEKLMREKLNTGTSLKELYLWAKERRYLPRLGQDFDMIPIEVVSPSGIKVKFCECGVREGSR